MGRRPCAAAWQERESPSKLSRSGLETTWRSLCARCVLPQFDGAVLCLDQVKCVLNLVAVQILHKLFLEGDDFDASELQEVSYNSPVCQPSVGNLDVAVTQRLLEQSSARTVAFDGRFEGRLFLSCSDSDSPGGTLPTLPSPSREAQASAPLAVTSSPDKLA